MAFSDTRWEVGSIARYETRLYDFPNGGLFLPIIVQQPAEGGGEFRLPVAGMVAAFESVVVDLSAVLFEGFAEISDGCVLIDFLG